MKTKRVNIEYENKNPCTKCVGSGVQEYITHGPTDEGEIGEEPIRCTRCDGVGSEPKMTDWHKPARITPNN